MSKQRYKTHGLKCKTPRAGFAGTDERIGRADGEGVLMGWFLTGSSVAGGREESGLPVEGDGRPLNRRFVPPSLARGEGCVPRRILHFVFSLALPDFCRNLARESGVRVEGDGRHLTRHFVPPSPRAEREGGAGVSPIRTYKMSGIWLCQVSCRTQVVSPVVGLGIMMGLSAAAHGVAIAPKADATQPLRQFLAAKSGLKLQRQGATQFSFASGAWHGTQWTQRARVFTPRNNLFPGTATLLLLTDPVLWDGVGGQLAADATGTTVVMVYDVPNQPLWGRRENGLLGYSIQKTAQTNDPTWSVAFPMARAVSRSMDAVQSWSAKSGNPLKKFVLVGFSKRALAAWLVADDPRVRALVSLGYNNLNLEGQARLQKQNWGQLSTHWTQMVGINFEKQLQTPRGAALVRTWDPYSFCADIRVPKLLVDATNNDYWSLDSPSQFADRLNGPTNWLYFANAGHTMDRAVPTLLQTSALWIRRTLEKKPLENPTLSVGTASFGLRAPGASDGNIQVAWSESRDFRQAEWVQLSVKHSAAGWAATRPTAPKGARFVAVFGAADYPNAGGVGTLQLSSRVTILQVR